MSTAPLAVRSGSLSRVPLLPRLSVEGQGNGGAEGPGERPSRDASQVVEKGVTGDGLRAVFRRLPYPVAVVTTGGAGEARGMTINSLTSVSLEPPLVSFTVDRAAQMHAVIAVAEGFAVHIVGAHQTRLCERFAEPDRSGWEQFASVLYGFDRDGNPVLGGALAVLRCRMYGRFVAGDHTIVVGEVVEVQQHEGGAPLLYHNRAYCSIGGLTPAAPAPENTSPVPSG